MKRMILALSLLLAASATASELSNSTARSVQRAQQLQQEEQFREAIDKLTSLAPKQAYDQAFVARMLGVLYWQNQDPQNAIAQLTQAVNSGLLVDKQAWTTQRMLADILLSTEQYQQALPHYYQLLSSPPEPEKVVALWLLITQIHYQLTQWQKVLSGVKNYAQVADANTKPILSMTLGAQLGLKRWDGALTTLAKLIALEPNHKAWWQQTYGIQLRQNRPKDALATLALAKRQGIALKPAELKTLAQLYAQQGIPERAAKIYADLWQSQTQEQRDPELLATQAIYWQQAKEWQEALTTWQQAAELDNRHRWPLAQLLIQEKRYEQALAELERVNPNDKNAAETELAKARTHYKLKAFDKALHYAKRADHIESTASSRNWIAYLSQMDKMQDNTTRF